MKPAIRKTITIHPDVWLQVQLAAEKSRVSASFIMRAWAEAYANAIMGDDVELFKFIEMGLIQLQQRTSDPDMLRAINEFYSTVKPMIVKKIDK